MKLFAVVTAVFSFVLGVQHAALACDQKLADKNAAKIKIAINARDNAALEKYAVQQAGVYHACALENRGHTKTRYLLGEAASWDQAAQALNNESAGNLQTKQRYAREAIKIASPIAVASSSSTDEKKVAKAILWTLSWAHAS